MLWVRAYERRGKIFSDHVLLERQALIERLKAVPDCRTAVVQDTGHMLHHDQPQAVAALIESFLEN